MIDGRALVLACSAVGAGIVVAGAPVGAESVVVVALCEAPAPSVSAACSVVMPAGISTPAAFICANCLRAKSSLRNASAADFSI